MRVVSKGKAFLADRHGGTAVEYALVAGLVGLAVMGVAPQLSGAFAARSAGLALALTPATGGSSSTTVDEAGGRKARNFVN